MVLSMQSENPDITLEDFVRNARAPIEQPFHNHQWCDASWCPFKDWDEKELEGLLKYQEREKTGKNPLIWIQKM